jgi:hypothetical protein
MSSNTGGHPEKSDFIGGLHWHVPMPDPVVSEQKQLLSDARNGDLNAIRRCKQLYGLTIKPPVKKKTRKR